MPVDPLERAPTLLESALRYERASAALILLLVPAVSWLWIVIMARDMYGPMTGASAWMMTTDWDATHLVLLWAMWAVMMTGMMLPTAAPLILLYGAAARRSPQPAPPRTYALAAGYVAAWAAFSLAATVLQRVLTSLFLVSPMMEAASTRVSGTLLLVAGLYQLTPLKYACLRKCQSPLAFLMGKWRAGATGAFRMGLEHGWYCVGCCWGLMLLLFAGGVMNLVIIVALAAVVAVEKMTSFGVRGARLTGVLLIAAGGWLLIH